MFNFSTYSFADLKRSGFVGIRQHDNKLFSAISRGEIATTTHVPIDTFRKMFQRNITLSMTVTVAGDILGSGPVEQQFVTQAPIHGLDSRLVERGDQGEQRIVRRF